MGVFGPRYPPRLQAIVSHAERMFTLLARVEARKPPTEELARAWLVGRSNEVETVLAVLVSDWRSGVLTENEVTKSVAAYLRLLHLGAERHLNLGSLPECCLGEFAITPLYPAANALAAEMHRGKCETRGSDG